MAGLKTRKTAIRERKERILIVCEGEQTEPNYFEDFSITSATVLPIGIGNNGLAVVQEAVKRKKAAKKENDPYDQVWAVFDKDSFPNALLRSAFALAEANGIQVSFSNEAFELWFLLHFDRIESSISRNRYEEMLSARLETKYHKNMRGLYDMIHGKVETAIRNAKSLLDFHKEINGQTDLLLMNPSTTVFQLVEILRKYERK